MKWFKAAGLLVTLVFALLFPLLFSNAAITTVAIFTLLFAGAATGWNIFSGYTGYISLGHAAFYGIGAYALALMCQDWHIQGGYTPFLLFPLVGLVTGLIAIPLGWVALRTRRYTFVVITIAIFFMLQLLANNLQNVTNGSRGMYLPVPPWDGAVFNVPFYYVALILLVFALAVSWWIRNSKFGLGLLAIRDDEDRALTLGVKTGSAKLSAFVISAIIVGMAGALYAYFVEFIYPSYAFDPSFDVTVAVIVFLGGVGTLSGPILGAVLLVPLQQYLTLQYGQNGVDLMIYGALFLAVILLLPEGIIPAVRRQWETRMNARKTVSFVHNESNQENALLTEKS